MKNKNKIKYIKLNIKGEGYLIINTRMFVSAMPNNFGGSEIVTTNGKHQVEETIKDIEWLLD